MAGPTQAELTKASEELKEAIAANIAAQKALANQEQMALETAVAANREARSSLKEQERVLRNTAVIIDSLAQALGTAQDTLADMKAAHRK